jgi:cephalosporin hydroxylase
MILSLIRSAAKAITPQVAVDYVKARRFGLDVATQLRRRDSLSERVDFARNHFKFRSNQKHPEIEGLLNRVAALSPSLVCEIGADNGGTLALLTSVAQPTARILSMDIKYRFPMQESAKFIVGPGQQLTCLERDSHQQETLVEVKKWLNGAKFDFLFIDGDHTYDGVKKDFEMYGPLVRSGGLIAFHDIVPDFKTRYGIATPRNAGEVPVFWKEVHKQFEEFEEFIEDPAQDGYGIGLIRVP